MNKSGFEIPITFEAIDALLRQHGQFEEGNLVGIYVDHDRDTLILRYHTEQKTGFVVGEACEYRRISGLITKKEILPILIFNVKEQSKNGTTTH